MWLDLSENSQAMSSKQFQVIIINFLNLDSDKQEFLEQERQKEFGLTQRIERSLLKRTMKGDSQQKAVDVQPRSTQRKELERRLQ